MFGCTLALVVLVLVVLLVVFVLRTHRARRPSTVAGALSSSDVTSYDHPVSSKSRLWFDETGSTRSLTSASNSTAYEQQRANVIKDAVENAPPAVRVRFNFNFSHLPQTF